jgi:hypothetical protein
MKKTKIKSNKPSYFLEILGVFFGISMFLVSISYDEKEYATGKITHNEEGLVSFQSYRLEAFYGILIVFACLTSIYFKINNNKNDLN